MMKAVKAAVYFWLSMQVLGFLVALAFVATFFLAK